MQHDSLPLKIDERLGWTVLFLIILNLGYGANVPQGRFINTAQTLDFPCFNVALGDLDGDGDLDAWLPCVEEGNKVLLNNGKGFFLATEQALDDTGSNVVALGDLDGDGDLDAFIGKEGPNRIWKNQGNGHFIAGDQEIGNLRTREVALGDFDGDGDLDTFFVGAKTDSRVWFNEGNGLFHPADQILSENGATSGVIGDLDGDGDLDVILANEGAHLWLNDGDGLFSKSNQILPNARRLLLGDLDGDGDLDIWLSNRARGSVLPDRMWLNDGTGLFFESEQMLPSLTLGLGDFDGDNDLDVLLGKGELLINDGFGTMSLSEHHLDILPSSNAAFGDLDNDGDLDIWVSGHPIKIFLSGETPKIHSVKKYNGKVKIDFSGTLLFSDTVSGEYLPIYEATSPSLVVPDLSGGFYTVR